MPDGANFPVVKEISIAESISGDRFTTGSRINALTGHAPTLLSQKPPKRVSETGNLLVYIGKSLHLIYVTLYYKWEVIVWR